MSTVTATKLVQPSIEVWQIVDGKPTSNFDLGRIVPHGHTISTIRFRTTSDSVNNLFIKRITEAPEWISVLVNSKSLKDQDMPVRNRIGGTMLGANEWSEDVNLEIQVGDGKAGYYQLELKFEFQAP